MKFYLVLLSIILLGCSGNAKKEGAESVLFNPVINADSLDVSVRSTGCTKADDFYLVVSGELIEIRRINPDLCRATPQLVRLSFSYLFNQGVYQFKNETRFVNRTSAR